jgi:hypothetical protein
MDSSRKVNQPGTDIDMESYDPDMSRPSADWLQMDEGERIELVSSYHRRKKIRLPNAQLHAVIHVVVENQLALGEEDVRQTLARLQNEGLSRHDALHAIGSVLAGDLYQLMQESSETTGDVYRRYLERLQRLTAKSWRPGS